MKEKIIQFVDRKPLLSGFAGGLLLCLVIFVLVQILPFGAGGTSFKDAESIIKEDYLRLAVRDYAMDQNTERAAWRFEQLGEAGGHVLALLKKDLLTDPLALLRFSDAVTGNGFPAKTVNLPVLSETAAQTQPAAAKSGSDGIPLVGIIFIILLILILLCLLFLFFFSERGKALRARFSDLSTVDFRSLLPKIGKKTDDNPGRWSVREDNDFDLGVIINRFPEEDFQAEERAPQQPRENTALNREPDSALDDLFDEVFEDENIVDTLSSDADLPWDEPDEEDSADPAEESEDAAFDLPESDEDEAEIHFSKTSISNLDFPENGDAENDEPEATVRRQAADMPLVHFQTTYQLGDDLFDETFSLDDEDEIFLGECGIGIAETINSTDPKAVTAFEIWLFDREDVQTPTFFLLSDFAYSNESLLNRLKNKGRFDRLSKGGEYLVESHTLRMKVKISALEYGTEYDERNSYFNQVAFDVTVWKK